MAVVAPYAQMDQVEGDSANMVFLNCTPLPAYKDRDMVLLVQMFA